MERNGTEREWTSFRPNFASRTLEKAYIPNNKANTMNTFPE